MLFLRTRGPRAIRSARPQRTKLTPASVTPANASKFATTPRGPDPRECGSDARAPVSRRLGGPAPGGPALAPLRPWIRPRASAGSSLSRSASLCRARQPSLRKARARFSRVPLRGSRTRIANRESRFLTTFARVSRQIFHGSSTQETPRVAVTRSEERLPIKNPSRVRNPRRKQLLARSRRKCASKTHARAVVRNGVERFFDARFEATMRSTRGRSMSKVLRDVKVYHGALCTVSFARNTTDALLEPGVFGLGREARHRDERDDARREVDEPDPVRSQTIDQRKKRPAHQRVARPLRRRGD